MELVVRIISNLDESRAVYASRMARATHMLDVAVASTARAAVAVITPAVQEETPVDTGLLKSTTGGDVIAMSEQAVAQVTQPAESIPGVYYAQFVIHGHRIVAWGYDTGRMQPPDDYPMRAYEHALPVLEMVTEQAAHEAVGVLVL